MNLQSLLTDNVTELLVKIVEFTQNRQKVLLKNINNMGRAGFVPKDLAVDEFSETMNTAIVEHVLNCRLVLRDTETIKFDMSGSLEIKPVADEPAMELLSSNPGGFLEFQMGKLMENSINQRVAAELLRNRAATASDIV